MRKVAVLALIAACYGSSAPPELPAKPADPPSRHARTASDPLGFLPIDADVVANIDAAALRRTQLWTRIEPSLMANAGGTLEQFKAACGFDPMPQIERVAIGMRNLSSPQLEGVVVLAGLSRTQLMSCMTRAIRNTPQVARIERNVVLLNVKAGERPVAFAFADARTLVVLIGERAATAQGLRDVLDAGAPLRGSELFMELFDRTSEPRHAWLFLNGAAKLFDNIGALGFHPRGLFGAINMPDGATAKIYARMPTAADATRLATMIQGQLPAVQALVEKFEITSDDVDVVVDIAVSEEQLILGMNLLGP